MKKGIGIGMAFLLSVSTVMPVSATEPVAMTEEQVGEVKTAVSQNTEDVSQLQNKEGEET